MLRPDFRSVRYSKAWLAGPVRVEEQEIVLDRDGTSVPATLSRPLSRSDPLPAWVVLHGITRRGRSHEQLARFTRALVSTGAAVAVPEVPEWRNFALAPRLALPTLKAALRGLRSSGWARDAPVGVVGFSFGAPHAIAATAHPDVRDQVAGSLGFGGYCSLERTIRFLLTGEHEWEGRVQRLEPDPYGRWIVAANYLTAVPGLGDTGDVADALRSLAAEAGDLGIPSNDAHLDHLKTALAGRLEDAHREIFELFAPAAHAMPDPERAERMGTDLAAAARRTDPGIEPAAALGQVRLPVHVLHGRDDNLIPCSEGLRLKASLPDETWSRVTITGLFGHSGQSSFRNSLRRLGDVPAFLRALSSGLRMV
ncbi:MAG TPA: hypothetical protein VLA09_11665 [Longimicrobiales bacterium]|nr:hypothetical protein [Longimicrobiales bacterium]